MTSSFSASGRSHLNLSASFSTHIFGFLILLRSALSPSTSTMLIVAVVVGVGFSISTVASCEFMSYVLLPGNDNSTLDQIPGFADDAGGNNVTTGTFGLLYYNPGGSGCRPYESIITRESLWLSTAKITGIIAAAAGIATLALLIVETVCCRFVCSRVIIVLLLMTAVICQALTFLVYASSLCLSANDVRYPCIFDSGSTMSVIALCAFLFAALAACPTPKPRPMIKTLMERERKTENSDPCCYCWAKKPVQQIKEESKHDEENDAAVPAQLPMNYSQRQFSPGVRAQIPPPQYYADDNMLPNNYYQRQPPQPYPNEMWQRQPPESPSRQYPDEIYAMTNPTTMPEPSDYDAMSSPLPTRSLQSPEPPRIQQQPPFFPQYPYISAPQYQYFAPHQPQSPFINAEVIEDDLFFDSKTV